MCAPQRLAAGHTHTVASSWDSFAREPGRTVGSGPAGRALFHIPGHRLACHRRAPGYPELRIRRRVAAIPVRGCLAGLGSVTVGGSLRGLRAIHRSLTRRRAVAVGARCSWHRRATVVGGISRPERVEAGVARLLRGDGALRVACHSVLRAVDAGVVRHIADVLARLPIKDDVDDGRGQKNDRDNRDQNEGLKRRDRRT